MRPESRRVVPGAGQLAAEVQDGTSLLPFGAGRTYGDTCVNSDGALLLSSKLNHIGELDADSGRIRCGAGATLAELHARTLPAGWVVPSCPGTAHVTLGGMVAHDVHGKNHVHTGTIGRHVRGLRVVRSDKGSVSCSPTSNTDLFQATIGGLGLTGFIEEIDLQLRPCQDQTLRVERIRSRSLDGTMGLLQDSLDHEYAFAWVDSFSVRGDAARCVVTRAAGVPGSGAGGNGLSEGGSRMSRAGRLIPAALFRSSVMRAFNRLYFAGRSPLGGDVQVGTASLGEFLFPQDSMHPSNHLYGRRGVFGHHSLVPNAECARAVLERVSRRGDQSLVTVLKAFGGHGAPGMLSFTGAGISIATGFLNGGPRTLGLLADLDAIVLEAGGKLYPAKDARMPRRAFERSFPQAEAFAQHVDPAFSSNFWRRVGAQGE